MLELQVYDDGRRVVLKFEHSLRSLSKWEQKNKKPFMTKDRNALDMIDYFQDMLLNTDEDPNLVYRLSPEQLEELGNYINDSQTASSVPKGVGAPSREQITSELVYYWMTELRIDWEAQDWHFNRLMMLIQITNYKRQPVKKQRVSDFKAQWAAANAARKKELNSNG